MNLKQTYSDLLADIAEQHEDWSATSESPFTISRQAEEKVRPLSISVFGSESKAHLFFNLYNDNALSELAKKFLRVQNKDKIQTNDEESGLVIIIDSDGFAVVYDATKTNIEDFTPQFENIAETADALLMTVVADAYQTVENADVPSIENTQTEQVEKPSIEHVLKQYFTEKDYKYKYQEDKQRFVLGFNTEHYLDDNGDPSFNVVLDYSDKGLLRFLTPFLYKFDLNKTQYSLIASAVAWFQFRYKFLSMSLDPSDGELRISIDIPLADGVLHKSQVHRIMSFILQFTEDSYQELFSLMLSEPNESEKKLKEIIANYKQEIETGRWLKSLEDKMQGITEAQKQAIENILNQSESSTGKGGI
ncbi:MULTISPECIES: hypothetical protein [unclassified Colwellia]|jgi:hypothetical protein|uniref:hypothetical protein n=1 Tax=unclassified Colwellia TaxID=196834 RepID=UPI0015F6EC66|nr:MULTISPECIES: hypothetical protein [unclassified Colwellia]MBA6379952.1 hypothetical protein [Colwellia sp. BRX10-7]MBA6386478.1 hypothetical protein [Colwellia sp. BRX10-2]MBA6401588.1 hypothetical protein [Colwellia sp. BRX10-5]MBA6406179.1 hypothetical protein [Colwellia sp. BRX10-1]